MCFYLMLKPFIDTVRHHNFQKGNESEITFIVLTIQSFSSIHSTHTHTHPIGLVSWIEFLYFHFHKRHNINFVVIVGVFFPSTFRFGCVSPLFIQIQLTNEQNHIYAYHWNGAFFYWFFSLFFFVFCWLVWLLYCNF